MFVNMLLEGPSPPSCTSRRIDFKKEGLPEYADAFAIIIDNLLTPEECAALLTAAESTVNGKWEQALVNVGGGRQMMLLDARNCGRIIWDDVELASKIQARIMPHLPEEIVALSNKAGITGSGPVRRRETWQMTRLNERLRFLKYTSGMYFREHCDGSYVTPDGKEVSFLTVHVYLNGEQASKGTGVGKQVTDLKEKEGPVDEENLVGGATRFWSLTRERRYMDYAPVMGSCIIFQHRGLVHSGEDVVTGTKYTMRSDIMYARANV